MDLRPIPPRLRQQQRRRRLNQSTLGRRVEQHRQDKMSSRMPSDQKPGGIHQERPWDGWRAALDGVHVHRRNWGKRWNTMGSLGTAVGGALGGKNVTPTGLPAYYHFSPLGPHT